MTTAARVGATGGAADPPFDARSGGVALVAAAVAAVGLIWTGYKAIGAAAGDVSAGTSRPLPAPPTTRRCRTCWDDRCGGSVEPRAAPGRRAALAVRSLERVLVHASGWRSSASLVGVVVGARPGRRSCSRSHWLERGLLPWVIVSPDRAAHRARARSSSAWGAQLRVGLRGSPGCRSRSSRPTSPSSRSPSARCAGSVAATGCRSSSCARYAATGPRDAGEAAVPGLACPYLLPALKLARDRRWSARSSPRSPPGCRAGIGRADHRLRQQASTRPRASLCAAIFGAACSGLVVVGLDRRRSSASSCAAATPEAA